MLNRVFLSHSDVDHALVKPLYEDLQAVGFDVWFDQVRLFPGDSIAKKIETGIVASNFVLIVLTPDSVASKWVEKEALMALSLQYSQANIMLIPILMKQCNAIPKHLGEILYANFADETSRPREFGKLLVTLLRGMSTESCTLRCVSRNAIVSATNEYVQLPNFPPSNVLTPCDENNSRDYWLMPDDELGTLTMKLLRPYHLRYIRILNTKNSTFNDRAANEVAVSLSLGGVQPRTAWTGALHNYPEWFELWLSPWYADTITVDVLSNRKKRGGGLNCVEAYVAAE